MTIQEIIRLREQIRAELDGGADHGAPATRLIQVRQGGYLVAIKWLGGERILSRASDFDRLLREVQV